jgi:hypothetical protein
MRIELTEVFMDDRDKASTSAEGLPATDNTEE